jgi:hypothetical protein
MSDAVPLAAISMTSGATLQENCVRTKKTTYESGQRPTECNEDKTIFFVVE